MQELQFFFKLPQAYGEDRKWRFALSAFKDQYEELGMPLSEFNVIFPFHLEISHSATQSFCFKKKKPYVSNFILLSFFTYNKSLKTQIK